MSEGSVRTLVLAGVILVALLPAVSSQSPVNSQVQLTGDPPTVVQLDTRRETEFTIEYSYVGPLTAEDSTTVSLSVAQAPDWLVIDLPSEVEIPVESTGQQASTNVTVAFRVREGYFPLAFQKHVVGIQLEAEDNGGVDGSSNTRSWVLEAGYEPLFGLQVSNTPVRLTGQGLHQVTITLENLANAPVEPSFRFLDVPAGIQTGMASSNGVLGTPARGEQPTTTSAVVLVRDKGSDWSQQTITVRATMTPIWGEQSTSRDVEIFVVKEPDVAGAIAPLAVLATAGAGLAWYVVRYRRVDVAELFPDP